jgi:hypothetical protein
MGTRLAASQREHLADCVWLFGALCVEQDIRVEACGVQEAELIGPGGVPCQVSGWQVLSCRMRYGEGGCDDIQEPCGLNHTTISD